MNTSLKRSIPWLVLASLLAVFPMAAFGSPKNPKNQSEPATANYIEREVRKALVTQPFYTIFDNLEFRVEGHHVDLYGQVVQPGTLKTDAENAVKRVEGVESVTNHIQLLPLSPVDDQIRRAEYRAIFGGNGGVLSGYSMGANPSIHIIVANGHVTLVGVVGTQMDKTMAEVQANHVPGVFSVTDNLQVRG